MAKPELLSIVLLGVLLLAVNVSGWRQTDETEDSRELLMTLQNVLEKLQSRKFSTLDRRQSRLPPCSVGAWCSVKKGPRFGPLCDCQQGSRCNFFFRKCL
ncbi:cocaine- and amphetamine-regulated transcript protein-like [Melanotaenia boesemani]|uniref:cocaine- and amphetamine-regulated transcript protein-like n=1 Tax=Melanotaenia boesemani TaxID=1250792 RepID=UPI001C043AEB|nr:cocaine- and amphetamine-regulated transcript protein-like [Melanotaenia boesemani]